MKAKREDLVREHEKQLAAKLKSDEAEGLGLYYNCCYPIYYAVPMEGTTVSIHFSSCLVCSICSKSVLFNMHIDYSSYCHSLPYQTLLPVWSNQTIGWSELT